MGGFRRVGRAGSHGVISIRVKNLF
jgi:hypothetical protein